jgi:hypothetical protein
MPQGGSGGQQTNTAGFTPPTIGDQSGFSSGRPGVPRGETTPGQAGMTEAPSQPGSGGRIPGYVLDERGKPFSPVMYLSTDMVAQAAESASMSYDTYVSTYLSDSYYWNPQLGQYQFSGTWQTGQQPTTSTSWWEQMGYATEKKANQAVTKRKQAQKEAEDRENPRKNGQFNNKKKGVGTTTATSTMGTG